MSSFHLWVPSGVQVTRELSWLSEGWAMHMGRLAAVDVGWLSQPASIQRLQDAYRRYLDIGGYRAGSLPEASMGSESRRDLLYLRGELVFRLLERQWALTSSGNFETELWRALADAYDGPHAARRRERSVSASIVGRPRHRSAQTSRARRR